MPLPAQPLPPSRKIIKEGTAPGPYQHSGNAVNAMQDELLAMQGKYLVQATSIIQPTLFGIVDVAHYVVQTTPEATCNDLSFKDSAII